MHIACFLSKEIGKQAISWFRIIYQKNIFSYPCNHDVGTFQGFVYIRENGHRIPLNQVC